MTDLPKIPQAIEDAIDTYVDARIQVFANRAKDFWSCMSKAHEEKERLAALIGELVAERDKLRQGMVAVCNTATYGVCSDSVSTDFLLLVPKEAALCKQGLEAERDAERENFNLLSQRCAGAESQRNKAEAERDAARAELAAAVKRAEDAYREAAGYQKLAQEAANAEKPGLLVLLVSHDGAEVRIFGPDRSAEERFGETVARWWKLVNVVAESLAVEAMEKERDACCDDYQQEAARAARAEAELAAVKAQRDELKSELAAETERADNLDGDLDDARCKIHDLEQEAAEQGGA